MRLTIRPAGPSDVPSLVEIYDRAYHGGYSACFDRYGPSTPQDFWWIQSEKPVYLIDVNQLPCGLIILGGAGRQWLVEEVLVHTPDAGREPARRAKLEEAGLNDVHDFVIRRFQEERQGPVRVRGTGNETVRLLLCRPHCVAVAHSPSVSN